MYREKLVIHLPCSSRIKHSKPTRTGLRKELPSILIFNVSCVGFSYWTNLSIQLVACRDITKALMQDSFKSKIDLQTWDTHISLSKNRSRKNEPVLWCLGQLVPGSRARRASLRARLFFFKISKIDTITVTYGRTERWVIQRTISEQMNH